MCRDDDAGRSRAGWSRAGCRCVQAPAPRAGGPAHRPTVMECVCEESRREGEPRASESAPARPGAHSPHARATQTPCVHFHNSSYIIFIFGESGLFVLWTPSFSPATGRTCEVCVLLSFFGFSHIFSIFLKNSLCVFVCVTLALCDVCVCSAVCERIRDSRSRYTCEMI